MCLSTLLLHPAGFRGIACDPCSIDFKVQFQLLCDNEMLSLNPSLYRPFVSSKILRAGGGGERALFMNDAHADRTE